MSRSLTLLCIALAGTLVFSASAQQKRQTKAAELAPKPPVADTSVPAPFRSGEQLNFRVLWTKYSVNAATVNFSVLERRDFFGTPAWHFRAVGHTTDTARLLYPLDDQADSYSETAHLASLQYELYLHEMGRQVSNVFRMLPAGDPAPSSATAARVAPGTRDPIGVLYALRTVDWKATPEFRAPVFDGVHQYEVVARLGEPSGQVTVPAGSFQASRVDMQVLEKGKDLPEMHFGVWMAQDAARTPILVEIEAPAPVGTARVELTSTP